MAQGVYQIVPDRSMAQITVSGAPGRIRAEVPFSGSLVVSGGVVTEVTTRMDTRALNTRSQMAARQMRGPKGFDVDNHPAGSFSASRIRQNGDEITVDGNLTIKGVTLPATFSGRIVRFNQRRIQAVLEGTIDRTAFGVTAGRPLYGRSAEVRMHFVARRPTR
ncbi:YceI family protein [Acuticoccus sp. MNP-M23]|uniref:YceI family protein n=1 Tax=Acuticoccus sp. MNP-M23 TaxID=3072793 RepID=UPI0028164E6D|nr:YceI family protein [Acuticoccus sp. MNP-M23]WMS40986.1 YceI family protein [Acuticoccus sp. MNP-M23]